MTLISAERLKKFAPNARPDIAAAIVNGANELDAAGINTPLRAAHFLAQIATETGGLRLIEENLNYTAKRLTVVWPKRFPALAAAQPYARNPEKLANKVYGGRLGNTQPGDGWRYRGSGMMQTTGRSNFRAAGHENDPEALRTPGPALTSALKFWTDHKCNALADKDAMTKLRKVINGGTNGLNECRVWLGKAKQALRSARATDLTMIRSHYPARFINPATTGETKMPASNFGASLTRVINSPLAQELATAVAGAARDAASKPGNEMSATAVGSVQAQSDIKDEVLKEIAASPQLQHVTNAEAWWRKRSRWSAIIGTSAPILGIVLKLIGVEWEFGPEKQVAATDAFMAIGTLWAAYLALRAGLATKPLGA